MSLEELLKMEPVKKLKKILKEGEQIQKEGLSNHSRKETANLLGIKQLTQFDNTKNDTIFLECWILAHVPKKHLSIQEEYTRRLLGYNFIPGTYEEKEVKEALSKTNVGQEIQEYVLNYLVHGKPPETSAQKLETVMQATRNTVAIMNKVHLQYNEALNRFIPDMEERLKHFSAPFFLQILTSSSEHRVERLIKGEATLSVSEAATLFMVTLLEKEELYEIEDVLFSILNEIEEFRYDRYVNISKLSPLLLKDPCYCEKTPLWVKFFDHDKRAQFPLLKDLIKIYEGVKEIQVFTADRVREMFHQTCGQNKRLGIFDFAKAEKLINEEGLSLNEVHRRLQPRTDVANFYRSFKLWKKNRRKFKF